MSFSPLFYLFSLFHAILGLNEALDEKLQNLKQSNPNEIRWITLCRLNCKSSTAAHEFFSSFSSFLYVLEPEWGPRWNLHRCLEEVNKDF